MATIIGGAKISFDDAMSNHDIGERNIAIAREVMAEFCVPVTARSVGGYVGRRVLFNTATGRINIDEFKVSDCPGQDVNKDRLH